MTADRIYACERPNSCWCGAPDALCDYGVDITAPAPVSAPVAGDDAAAPAAETARRVVVETAEGVRLDVYHGPAIVLRDMMTADRALALAEDLIRAGRWVLAWKVNE